MMRLKVLRGIEGIDLPLCWMGYGGGFYCFTAKILFNYPGFTLKEEEYTLKVTDK